MKNLWLILLAGIILRIFLSFSTFHPDIAALSSSGQFVTQGHILDLYDYSSEALVLNYPPFIYWFFGFFNLLFNGSFPLLKLSYLIFDLSLGFLLYKLVEPKKALLVLSLWIFNPINLYSTYMMGQFDIIPTFFTVLSIYFITKNKLSLSALALGFGIAFKLYPVFLIIPLIILARSYWDKVKLLVIVALPYFLSILPYLSSSSFRSNALFASQSSKSLYAAVSVSGGESILLFPATLILFYLYIWHSKIKGESWRLYSIPLLLFFIFTHYHPQWLIWITPFLIWDLVVTRAKYLVPLPLIFLSWFASLFFFDPSLTLGIFSPINPQLMSVTSIWDVLNIKIDLNLMRSLTQTLFVACAVYLIYQYSCTTRNDEV